MCRRHPKRIRESYLCRSSCPAFLGNGRSCTARGSDDDYPERTMSTCLRRRPCSSCPLFLLRQPLLRLIAVKECAQRRKRLALRNTVRHRVVIAVLTARQRCQAYHGCAFRQSLIEQRLGCPWPHE